MSDQGQVDSSIHSPTGVSYCSYQFLVKLGSHFQFWRAYESPCDLDLAFSPLENAEFCFLSKIIELLKEKVWEIPGILS